MRQSDAEREIERLLPRLPRLVGGVAAARARLVTLRRKLVGAHNMVEALRRALAGEAEDGGETLPEGTLAAESAQEPRLDRDPGLELK